MVIIEPYDSIREMTEQFAKEAFPGTKVLSFANAHDGFQIVQSRKPKLVTVCWEVHRDVNGAQLARRIRDIDPSYKPTIGLVTGTTDANGIGDLFDFTLLKPFTKQAYVDILRKYLL